jgi:hypothetical protein
MAAAGASAADFVKKTIEENSVVVFSKTTCPYCDMAKASLSSVNAMYTSIELDTRGDGAAIQVKFIYLLLIYLLFIYLFIYLFICLFIYLFIYLCIYLFTYLFIYLSIYLFIYCIERSS